MYSFKTNSKSKLIVNKSKFFSFSFFINDVNDVKEILKQMHNEYPDASHICYAYILDDSANNHYYSDDGEPNKTAGFPIYNLMKKNQLFYSLIVVVRYFGGIKLGTTNLKNAFLSVASDLIKTENLCEIKQTLLYQIKIDYSQIKIINRQFNNQIIDRKYNDLDVTFLVWIEKEQINLLTDYDATLVNNKYIVKCYNI